MRLRDFSVLTFDCYGTLIDWERGIVAALAPWRERAGVDVSDEALLEAFARHESRQQAQTPSMRYPELLARVHEAIAGDFGAEATPAERAAFGASAGDWPAFADAPEALAYLERHYRLVVLSNVDNDSFARSRERLGVEFDAVYTAEDIGSYKPDPRNFEYLLACLGERGIERGHILHVAQSLYHDHVPAKVAGLASAWIDRRAGRPGGATRTPDARAGYDFRFPSLCALCDAHRAERGA